MGRGVRLLNCAALALLGFGLSTSSGTSADLSRQPEQRLTCLRVSDPQLEAAKKPWATDQCPAGSVLVALADSPKAVAAPAATQDWLTALLRGGTSQPNGPATYCVSRTKRLGGGFLAVRPQGPDPVCPSGFSALQAAPIVAGGTTQATTPPGPQRQLARQDFCLPTTRVAGPGFRLLSERCPSGFVQVAGDNPAAVGVSFDGARSSGRVDCLPVTTGARARALGLNPTGGCPAGSIAVAGDNPASVGLSSDFARQGGQRKTVQVGQDYCLPIQNGLGGGFPAKAAACPAGFVRVTSDARPRPGREGVAPAGGICELPAGRQLATCSRYSAAGRLQWLWRRLCCRGRRQSNGRGQL